MMMPNDRWVKTAEGLIKTLGSLPRLSLFFAAFIVYLAPFGEEKRAVIAKDWRKKLKVGE